MSAPAAVLAYYDSLPAAAFPGGARPAVYFTAAPQVTGAGAAVTQPYAVVTDWREQDDPETQGYPVYTARFKVSAYFEKLADVDQWMRAVRYGGQAPTAFAGFDMAAALAMTGYTYLPYSLCPDGPAEQAREPQAGAAARYVHRGTIPYRMQYQLTAAYPTTTTTPAP